MCETFFYKQHFFIILSWFSTRWCFLRFEPELFGILFPKFRGLSSSAPSVIQMSNHKELVSWKPYASITPAQTWWKAASPKEPISWAGWQTVWLNFNSGRSWMQKRSQRQMMISALVYLQVLRLQRQMKGMKKRSANSRRLTWTVTECARTAVAVKEIGRTNFGPTTVKRSWKLP